MNNRQNAKLNMYQTVLDTAEKYKTQCTRIPKLKTTIEALASGVETIRQLAEDKQTAALRASSNEKAQVENQMNHLTLTVAGSLYALGVDTENYQLINHAHITSKTLTRAAGNQKLTIARSISTFAQANESELEPYGIEPETIAALQKAVEDYNAVISKPRDTIASHKQINALTKEQFYSVDTILSRKVDKLMFLFKDIHPDLYLEYQNARKIINTSIRHKKENK